MASAGSCEEHRQDMLFRCKSCDVWICHSCTVTDHRTDKCNIISIKDFMKEKKEKLRAQIQQSIKESQNTLADLRKCWSKLQDLDDEENPIMLEQEQIQSKYKELTQKAHDTREKASSAKSEGDSLITAFLKVQDDLEGADQLEDVDVCAQKTDQFRERTQNWMEEAEDITSGMSFVGHIKNLKMISSFTLELTRAVQTLSGDQIEAIIDKTWEFVLLSGASVYVEVEVHRRPLFAKVSTTSKTSAVLGDWDRDSPPAKAYVMKLADVMEKFSHVYVQAKTPQKQLYLPLVKDSKGCFWMEDQQDASPPSHLNHLLVPMTTLLRSGRVWFKHWFAQRFSKLKYMTSISRREGKFTTSLRAFQRQHPPEASFIMTEKVAQMLSPRVVAFLGLAWDGETQGHLEIQLAKDDQRSVQFQLLCCGDDGTSYRKCQLLDVRKRGRPGENIVGGDYDGEGGRSLLSDLSQEEVTSHPVTAGLVANKPNSAQFVIYTRGRPDATDPLAIGEVISGMDVLEDVLEVKNIWDVILSQCGCYWYFNF